MLRITNKRGRFHIEGHRAEAGFLDVMKWQFSGQQARWPAWIENRTHPRPPQRVAGDRLLATWIGHATVLIQTAGLNILTDPFLSLRASPVQWAGPKRVRAAAGPMRKLTATGPPVCAASAASITFEFQSESPP